MKNCLAMKRKIDKTCVDGFEIGVLVGLLREWGLFGDGSIVDFL